MYSAEEASSFSEEPARVEEVVDPVAVREVPSASIVSPASVASPAMHSVEQPSSFPEEHVRVEAPVQSVSERHVPGTPVNKGISSSAPLPPSVGAANTAQPSPVQLKMNPNLSPSMASLTSVSPVPLSTSSQPPLSITQQSVLGAADDPSVDGGGVQMGSGQDLKEMTIYEADPKALGHAPPTVSVPPEPTERRVMQHSIDDPIHENISRRTDPTSSVVPTAAVLPPVNDDEPRASGDAFITTAPQHEPVLGSGGVLPSVDSRPQEMTSQQLRGFTESVFAGAAVEPREETPTIDGQSLDTPVPVKTDIRLHDGDRGLARNSSEQTDDTQPVIISELAPQPVDWGPTRVSPGHMMPPELEHLSDTAQTVVSGQEGSLQGDPVEARFGSVLPAATTREHSSVGPNTVRGDQVENRAPSPASPPIQITIGRVVIEWDDKPLGQSRPTLPKGINIHKGRK
jgi:hypothetical protein